MLVAFLIMLREGIEASLIVGIIASYLAQTGRRQYLGAVWAGVVIAAVICAAIGAALTAASAEFPQRQQEMFESAVALVAAIILTSMVFWMKSAAKSIKAARCTTRSTPRCRPRAARRSRSSRWPFSRSAARASSPCSSCSRSSSRARVPACRSARRSASSARSASGFSSIGGGVKLDLRRFFRFTGVFIIFVAAGLLAGGLRSLHEAGLWNGLQQVVADWSNVLPADGALGTVLAGMFGYNDNPTLGEVLIYLAYLIPALILFFLPARSPAPVPRHA